MEKQSGNVVFYQPYKYSSLTGLQGKLKTNNLLNSDRYETEI